MRYLIFIIFIFLFNIQFAQLDTFVENNLKYEYPRMECRYDSSSSGKVGPKTCKYWIGKKRVTKEEYDKHLLYPNEVSKCNPCYLIYKINNKIKYEGEFYQDCGIGVYIERYGSGKIKEKGYFEPLGDTGIREFANAGKCSTKTGEWFYYKENGELEKKVLYKSGIEVN